MKKQFTALQVLMVQMRELLGEIWREQNEEIGAVNRAHRAILDAYEEKQSDMRNFVKVFEAKLNENLSEAEMLAEFEKATCEMEKRNEKFETEWGNDLDEHEAKIAKIKAKYETMYQNTMKKAGYNLNAVNAE